MDTATQNGQAATPKTTNALERISLKLPKEYAATLVNLHKEANSVAKEYISKEKFIGEFIQQKWDIADTDKKALIDYISELEAKLIQPSQEGDLPKEDAPNWKQRFYIACGLAGVLLIGFLYQLGRKLKAQAAL